MQAKKPKAKVRKKAAGNIPAGPKTYLPVGRRSVDEIVMVGGATHMVAVRQLG